MHKPSTNNLKFDQRVVRRLEQSNATISALYGKKVIEVFVFGSYAKGKHKRFSSIDLFIVLKKSDERFLKRSAQIAKVLNEDDQIPTIDALVYTEAELLELIHKKESFIISALNEGVVIWDGINKIDIEKIEKKKFIHSRYSHTTPDLKEVEIE